MQDNSRNLEILGLIYLILSIIAGAVFLAASIFGSGAQGVFLGAAIGVVLQGILIHAVLGWASNLARDAQEARLALTTHLPALQKSLQELKSALQQPPPVPAPTVHAVTSGAAPAHHGGSYGGAVTSEKPNAGKRGPIIRDANGTLRCGRCRAPAQHITQETECPQCGATLLPPT